MPTEGRPLLPDVPRKSITIFIPNVDEIKKAATEEGPVKWHLQTIGVFLGMGTFIFVCCRWPDFIFGMIILAIVLTILGGVYYWLYSEVFKKYKHSNGKWYGHRERGDYY